MSDHTRPDTGPAQALRIVIPCRNEQQLLPGLLDDLRAQRGIALRITVADGQSTDNTVDIARQHRCDVVTSAPGRGQQMNAGWQATNEADLLFLHADSRLPSRTLLADAHTLWAPRAERVAGHFRLEFIDTPQPTPFFYRHLESKTRLNKAQSFNGDQGLLIRRSFLQEVGGFDEKLPFLEDQAIGAAIRHRGELITLPGRLQTSARRFETEGRRARYFAMLLIMCAREAGCDDFLRDAPGLYKEQSATGTLDVAPLLERLITEAERRPESWPRVARYLRANAWQFPALLDSASDSRWQFREKYEQWLEPTIMRLQAVDPLLATALRWSFGQLVPRLLSRRQAASRNSAN